MNGKDRHLQRLLNLQKGAKQAARRVLFVGSDMVRAEAFRSISAGAISGKGHVASKPGEPPNRDTGHLQSQIETAMPDELVATVTSNAAYAASLEFGATIPNAFGRGEEIEVAARPYMRPARDKEKPRIRKLFAQEIDKLVKGS